MTVLRPSRRGRVPVPPHQDPLESTNHKKTKQEVNREGVVIVIVVVVVVVVLMMMVPTIVMNAGAATDGSRQSIFSTPAIMKKPTSTRGHPVASGGNDASTGARTVERAKSMAATTAVKPVLPPALMPWMQWPNDAMTHMCAYDMRYGMVCDVMWYGVI